MSSPSALLPALLKYWRHRSGMSQLDLSLAAEISSRHLSFLETGRAQPSREMVLRLAAALRVPLREQNALLVAAGHAPAFPEPPIERVLEGPVHHAIERMLAQHEPFPMAVVNRRYDVQRTNNASMRLFTRLLADPTAFEPPINAFILLFDPRLARPFVVDWERSARELLFRLHLEALARPDNAELAELVQRLLAYPDVPETWRQPDFSEPSPPTFSIRLRRDDLELAFLTTVTVFSAPGNVTLDELRIESYFPLDSATERACHRLAQNDGA